MADRIVRFATDAAPARGAATDFAAAFLGDARVATQGAASFFDLPGAGSPGLRRIELVVGRSHLVVTTRAADPFTEAVADALAHALARHGRGTLRPDGVVRALLQELTPCEYCREPATRRSRRGHRQSAPRVRCDGHTPPDAGADWTDLPYAAFVRAHGAVGRRP